MSSSRSEKPADDESLSGTITHMVAVFKGVKPASVSPRLDEAIDTEALNALCADRDGSSCDVKVSFTYSDCEIVISGDGRVRVQDLEGLSSIESPDRI